MHLHYPERAEQDTVIAGKRKEVQVQGSMQSLKHSLQQGHSNILVSPVIPGWVLLALPSVQHSSPTSLSQALSNLQTHLPANTAGCDTCSPPLALCLFPSGTHLSSVPPVLAYQKVNLVPATSRLNIIVHTDKSTEERVPKDRSGSKSHDHK